MEYLNAYIWPNYANRNELARDFFERAKAGIDALNLDNNCAFCLCYRSSPSDTFIVILVESSTPKDDSVIIYKRLMPYFHACGCPHYQESVTLSMGLGTTVDNLAERMAHNGYTIIEGPVIKRVDTPSSRLAEFVQMLISCDDPATSELVKFLVEMKRHERPTYCADIVQLLGTAVNAPQYFAEQPLTKCPPRMAVVFPKEAPEWGEGFLRRELAKTRKVIREAHLSPDNPDPFCRMVTQGIDTKPNISESYRLAIGLVIMDLFTQFGDELKELFWTCGDNEFLDSLLNTVKKQHLDALHRTADYIKTHWGWAANLTDASNGRN